MANEYDNATMFDVGEMLREIIVNDDEMASKVGSRVYPNALPDKTSYKSNSPDLPAMFYTYVSHTMDDASGTVWVRWQITVTANTQASLQEVCGALVRKLKGYRSGRIRYISVESASTDIDPDTKKPYAPIVFKVEFF